MGVIYVTGRKEFSYEEFKKLKEKILSTFKEEGFKTEDPDKEVLVRYEE